MCSRIIVFRHIGNHSWIFDAHLLWILKYIETYSISFKGCRFIQLFCTYCKRCITVILSIICSAAHCSAHNWDNGSYPCYVPIRAPTRLPQKRPRSLVSVEWMTSYWTRLVSSSKHASAPATTRKYGEDSSPREGPTPVTRTSRSLSKYQREWKPDEISGICLLRLISSGSVMYENKIIIIARITFLINDRPSS